MGQNSGNSNQKRSFWKTLTGILTAVGTFIAAIAALLAVFPKLGLFTNGQDVARVPPEHTIPRPDITTPQDERLRQKKIVIGGKLFPESNILLEMMAQVTESENPNLTVVRLYSLGDTFDTFYALQKGKIDVYAEYTGTLLAQLLQKSFREVHDPTFHEKRKLNQLLQENSDTNNLIWLRRFGFSNSAALVMLKRKATKLGIVKISDLRHVAGRLRFSSQNAFYTRSDGIFPLQREYKFFFKTHDLIYHTNKYRALVRNDMDITDGYETDPELNSKKSPFIELIDDEVFFPNTTRLRLSARNC